MKSFVSFLKYNNAVPIALTVFMVGAASTYAATNPEVILSEKQQVLSIDNSYIATVDLSNYSPTTQVTSVTEDVDFYYVTYTLSTIKLQDLVWQDVSEDVVMKVSKGGLGSYRDLGVYVTQQLKQVIGHELARLQETQKFEQKLVTHKQVATAYSGLIGAFLDEKTETVKNYTPIVVLPEEDEEAETFARPYPKKEKIVEEADVVNAETEAVLDSAVEATSSEPVVEAPVEPTINTRPRITILGENPIRVAAGSPYIDLGAVVSDREDNSLDITLLLDGEYVDSIAINTFELGTHVVTYRTVDSGGKWDEVSRTVVVYETLSVSIGTGSAGSGGGSSERTSTESGDQSTTTEQVSSTTKPTIEIPADEATSSAPVVETPVESEPIVEIPTEPEVVEPETPPAEKPVSEELPVTAI